MVLLPNGLVTASCAFAPGESSTSCLSCPNKVIGSGQMRGTGLGVDHKKRMFSFPSPFPGYMTCRIGIVNSVDALVCSVRVNGNLGQRRSRHGWRHY